MICLHQSVLGKRGREKGRRRGGVGVGGGRGGELWVLALRCVLLWGRSGLVGGAGGCA